jgi:hypothetical protein
MQTLWVVSKPKFIVFDRNNVYLAIRERESKGLNETHLFLVFPANSGSAFGAGSDPGCRAEIFAMSMIATAWMGKPRFYKLAVLDRVKRQFRTRVVVHLRRGGLGVCIGLFAVTGGRFRPHGMP